MTITTKPDHLYDADEVYAAHIRRITRGGDELWNWLLTLQKGEIITGFTALKIMDNYGLRIWDILFLFESKGCTVDLEEMCRLYNERPKMQKVCNVSDGCK
jgi:hypothetical protein